MNKKDLIAKTAVESGMDRKNAELAISTALDVIAKALEEGEKVQLLGFGTFEVRERPARMGRNPRTLEPAEIPASRTVAFRSGKALKEVVGK